MNPTFLKKILNDLRILEQNSEKDYQEKEYSAYEHYIQEYNKILGELKRNNTSYASLSLIQAVPDEEKAYMGIGSHAEIAKLKEVVIETQKLIRQVEGELGVKPHENNQSAYKYIFWSVVPILITMVGGAYYLGKDIGYSKFDKEKIVFEKENTSFKNRLDSLEINIGKISDENESLRNKLKLYEKDNIHMETIQSLTKLLEESISKARLMSSKYDKGKYENWEEEVLIALDKIDKNDNEIKAKKYFIEKMKEYEEKSRSVDPARYEYGIETLQKIILKMK